MKPYGIPKRKKLGPCHQHDLFECYCDYGQKSRARSEARKDIKDELIQLRRDSSANRDTP